MVRDAPGVWKGYGRRLSGSGEVIPRLRQSGQQLRSAQNSVREARPVDLVRRVHAFLIEGSRRVLDERDVVAEFHAEVSRAL